MSDIIERLRNISRGDHERGCTGREYVCTCGYDLENWQTADEAAGEIERLQRELALARSLRREELFPDMSSRIKAEREQARRQAFIEAAEIAEKYASAAAAKKRSQDAKSASGVSVLTGYIFAETEANAIAAALRKAAEV